MERASAGAASVGAVFGSGVLEFADTVPALAAAWLSGVFTAGGFGPESSGIIFSIFYPDSYYKYTVKYK
jgi:hypothetical protein